MTWSKVRLWAHTTAYALHLEKANREIFKIAMNIQRQADAAEARAEAAETAVQLVTNDNERLTFAVENYKRMFESASER